MSVRRLPLTCHFGHGQSGHAEAVRCPQRRPRWNPAATWLLLFAATVSICGCAQEGESKSTSMDPQGQQESVLFTPAEEKGSVRIQDDLARRDPGQDDWPTEVLHDKSKKVLHDFLSGMCLPEADFTALGDYLSKDFEGLTRLRPAQLEETFRYRRSWVRRAPTASQDLYGRDQLPTLLAELLQPAGSQGAHEEFKIVNVLPGERDLYETEVFLQLLMNEAQNPTQQNMEWTVTWRDSSEPEAKPKIHAIRLQSFEEVQLPTQPFGELTAKVFGHNEFFLKEFQRGANEFHQHTDRLYGGFFNGWHGIAVGDINGDGLEDIYVAQQGGLPNRLFQQNPDGTATDVAELAGVAFLDLTRGVLILDFDNDGDQDLAVTFGQNIAVCYNNGQGVFTEFARLEDDLPSDIHGINAADADGDGDLDLYACRYSKAGVLGAQPVPYHDAKNGPPNIYWRNDGPRRWVNATAEVGLDVRNHRFSLAAIWEDFDSDGDPDLFVANDFGSNSYYRNDGGRFAEIAAEIGASGAASSMGVSCADYDLDGQTDIYISNMFSSAGLRIASQTERFMEGRNQGNHKHYKRLARGNTLLRNLGNGRFEDVTDASGTALGRWAWGAKFVDFNNDSYEDIYVPNGYITNKDPDDL